MLDTSWTNFKAFATAKQLAIQYVEADDRYFLWCFDGPMHLSCQVLKDNGTDQIDFEDNYQAEANASIWQYDTDGAQIVRTKAAKKGWTYQALNFTFNTADLASSMYCKDYQGNDVPGLTLKAYDASGTEVTTPGLLNANLATITKTIVDFEPTFDYEVIGGSLRTATDISADMRLWIVAVPDVPANLGGSKEMAVAINMKYLTPGNVYEVDGRVAKYLPYDATYHTNKIRLIFTYPAGTTEALSVTLEYYRP